MGLFAKLKKAWFAPISWETLDENFYEQLEESMILGDMGMELAEEATRELQERAYKEMLMSGDQVKAALRDILRKNLEVGSTELDLTRKPAVILVIGVNGVGKTTSIGKLAYRLRKNGKKVLLCAADTFRAAAADQLEIWAATASASSPAPRAPPRRTSPSSWRTAPCGSP